MKLLKLIEGLENIDVLNKGNPEIRGFSDVSGEVKSGFLFGAFKGLKTDGINYIDDAINRGASAILTHKKVNYKGIPIIVSEKEREIFGKIIKKFYKNIDERLKLIGITGTNGKTSVSFILEALLNHLSFPVGVIGTIEYRWKNYREKARLTTPQVHKIYELFEKMSKDNVQGVIIEVSSHAIDTKRVEPLSFDFGVFTNLSGDHLDYHKTMESYFSVKKGFIKKVWKGGGKVFVNGDDKYGKRILEELGNRAFSFGLSAENDISVLEYELKRKSTQLKVKFLNTILNIKTNLIGLANVYNVLPAIGILKGFGVNFSEIEKAFESLRIRIPGRMEAVENPYTNIFIDYSHSDDSLRKAILTLKQLGFNRIITVFGAGGDRDKSKRPRMGRVATELSDISIITSDNPRSEDPVEIINDIIKGAVNGDYIVEVDRRKAIEKAVEIAEENDVVLIAGKGHEDYQILKDRIIHFSDFEEAVKAIKEVKGQW